MRAPPVAGRNLGSAHSGEFPVADELRPPPGVQKWLHQAGHLNITVATAEQVAHLNHVQPVGPHPVTDTERAAAARVKMRSAPRSPQVSTAACTARASRAWRA